MKISFNCQNGKAYLKFCRLSVIRNGKDIKSESTQKHLLKNKLHDKQIYAPNADKII